MKTDTFRFSEICGKMNCCEACNISGVSFHVFCSIMVSEREEEKEMDRINATDVPTAGRSHNNL